MLLLLSTCLLASTWAVRANGLSAPKLQCNENVAIPVTVSAENLLFGTGFNLTSLTQSTFDNLTDTLPTTLVSGTYTIAGRFCEPTVQDAKRRNTLQILVHGITFTRDYWSGLGAPGHQFNGTAYSWIDYAAKQGYPTFSVDRLCNGASTKANGLAECQVPLNAATLNGVIHAAKAGQFGGRKFDKVVYVGHSEGSFIGNQLAQTYPSSVDTYILTGFTKYLVIGAFGTILAGNFLPAKVVNPVRYAYLPLDLTYLTSTSKPGFEGTLFYGGFSPAIWNLEFSQGGTVTEGEFSTALLGQREAPGFTGALMVLDGEEDQIVCSRTVTDPLVGYRGDCGTGSSSYLAQTRSLYPNAKTFKYATVADTGHNQNLHYSAQQTFELAHEFLKQQGF